MLPDPPPVAEIPWAAPIPKVAPAPSVNLPGPFITPVLVIVRLPLHVKVDWPEMVITVPALVPVAVEDMVRLNLEPPLFPKENDFPASTEKPLVIVTVLSCTAAPKRQVPLTVRLERVIAGTAVTGPVRSLVIITASPSAGAPLGAQLPAVVQTPPAAVTHVFTAAHVGTALPIKTEAITNKSRDGIPLFVLI